MFKLKGISCTVWLINLIWLMVLLFPMTHWVHMDAQHLGDSLEICINTAIATKLVTSIINIWLLADEYTNNNPREVA